MKNIKFELKGEVKELHAESVEALVESLGASPGTINITSIEQVKNNLIQFKTNKVMGMIGLEVQIDNLILTFGYDVVKQVLGLKSLPSNSLT